VIRPEVEGKITEIFVRPGARVAAGATLMQIDPAKQQATLKSQEDTLAAKRASLEYARQQHERVSGLATSGIASKADLDQARAALDAARAELQALEARCGSSRCSCATTPSPPPPRASSATSP
jgi:multidrug efflux pump subunit AcrA (membrane-fusion protein)